MGISAAGRRVLDLLEAEGPELPVVVVARRTGVLPTQLQPIFDELHEAGLVDRGMAQSTVALVPSRDGGRFARPPARRPAPRA